jgi:hypothetical protein
MAHFAKIDFQTNIVLEVHVVDNDDIQNLSFPNSESIGIAFLIPWNTPNTYWKQTSYNKNFRKNYAGIGYTYNEMLDAFVPPKPFNSWVLDTDKAQWKAPVDIPTDDKNYTWNEETLTWNKETISWKN